MPPNRKNSTLFTSSFELENLKIPLREKFLPLTDPKEAAQQHEQQQKCVQWELQPDPKTEKTTPTVSYWDWVSDTVEEERLEAIDDLFSLSRFESNLIADSIRREEDSTVQVSVNKSKDNEEQTEVQQSYWGWSNEDIDDVEPEIDSQEDKPTSQTEYHHCRERCEDYWAWQQDEVTMDACSKVSPSRRLHDIVAESRKKFIRQHIHLPEPDPRADAIAASDHYWQWSEFQGMSAQ